MTDRVARRLEQSAAAIEGARRDLARASELVAQAEEFLDAARAYLGR